MYRPLFWLGNRCIQNNSVAPIVYVSATDAECSVEGGLTLRLPWERRLPQMEAIVHSCECFVILARHNHREVLQLGLAVIDERFCEQILGSNMPGEVAVLSCIGTLQRNQTPLQIVIRAPEEFELGNVPSIPPLFEHQARSIAHMRLIEQQPDVDCNKHLHIQDGWFVHTNEFFTRDPGNRRVSSLTSGGLLIDHAGSGKTATMLTYACQYPKDKLFGGTLVVVPLNLPEYWINEARTFCDGARILRMVRGQDARGVTMRDLLQADVVITTLQFLKSSKRYADIVENTIARVCGMNTRDCRTRAAMAAYARSPNFLEEQAIVEAVHWYRIVIDEVHDIFGASSMVRTLETLDACHWWGITATPDAMGPDGEAFWRWFTQDTSPYLLHAIRCKRTVCHTTDDVQQPYVRDVRLLTVDDASRDVMMAESDEYGLEKMIRRYVYTALTDDVEATTANAIIEAQLRECAYLKIGVRVLEIEADGNALDIAELSQALQTAKLRHAQAESRAIFSRGQIEALLTSSEVCAICMENVCGVMIDYCGHLFCRHCIDMHMSRNNNDCPQCREKIASVRGLILDDRPWNRAICIADLLESFGEESSVVFLQWKSLLRNVRAVLRGRNIRVFSLEGNVAQRNKTLSDHAQRGGALLLSMNESFAGLHLPHANHVVFAHALVGEVHEVRALEYQAISRCVRTGQQSSEVIVHSFLLRDFVEEEMWRAVHEEYRVRV